MTANNFKNRAIDALLAIGTDTAIDAVHRVAALQGVLYYQPGPTIHGDDRFELTTAGEAALAEAEALADSVTPPAEGEQTKRKRRTKAEMEAARAEEAERAARAAATAESTAESAEQIRRAISETPEDRKDPAAEEQAEEKAETEAEVDWDAEEKTEAVSEPAVTKTELIALLNRYAAKHPKKAAGAKEVIATYAGTESLSAVDPANYGAIATAMKLYLDAA